MIVVKHVDSIVGSLLPIRLSTFKLVLMMKLQFQDIILLGGVAVYLRHNICYDDQRLKEYNVSSENIELLWYEIKILKFEKRRAGDRLQYWYILNTRNSLISVGKMECRSCRQVIPE